MHKNCYRDRSCQDLRAQQVGQPCRLAGWIHRKRDHGNLIFIDLRDHYGTTQCVVDPEHPAVFQTLEHLPLESVISVWGKVVQRSQDTINKKIATGEVELLVEEVQVLSKAPSTLPLSVNQDQLFPEETRLKYRFLDLRKEKPHKNIVLRSQVIQFLRSQMIAQGFLEIQTPILTASSPEGARDYVVPSRLYPGHFYALPQAPQQFKQLLMVSGFDKYFQIAPCFRDEDARADRSPGEFYQLDFEMAFATQEDVFQTLEPVLYETFKAFRPESRVSPAPFPRIPYKEALLCYGSDKPDLRNPLKICDLSEFFSKTQCSLFALPIQEKGHRVRGIKVGKIGEKSRKFFDGINQWGKDQGLPGIGYLVFKEGELKGPITKFLSQEEQNFLIQHLNMEPMDGVFFLCGPEKDISKTAGKLRTHLGHTLELIPEGVFEFCWVTDFPMYEWDEKEKKIIFSHNPFSMPQGEKEALETKDPLEILAHQYDIVCNGIELSSGAIRNHSPEIMEKAFAIAGYSKEELHAQFGGLISAFQYGAPPHGGSAPGIDRIVMMLSQESNIREVIAFPMTQKAQDLLMNAPAPLPANHLKELHLSSLPLKK